MRLEFTLANDSWKLRVFLNMAWSLNTADTLGKSFEYNYRFSIE